MKTLVALVASLSAAGSMATAALAAPTAGPTPTAPANGNGDPVPPLPLYPNEDAADRTGNADWLELDRQIGRFASSYGETKDGFGWSILLRGAFVNAHERIATNNPLGARNGADVAGVNFNDLDVALWGSIRQYGWRLSFDVLGDDEQSSATQGGGNVGGLTFDTGDELQLEDAYAFWEWGGYFTVTAGNFKFPMTYSTGIDPENQLFIDRTAIGSHLDQWQAGIMFNGTWTLPQTVCGGAPLRWYFGVQDGIEAANVNTLTNTTGAVPPVPPNAQNSDSGSRFSWRLELDVGNGVGPYEGARRSNDRFNATLGVTLAQYETHTASDPLFAIDLNGDYRALGFGLEFARLGNTLGGPLNGDWGSLNVNNPLNMRMAGDSQPWAVMFSYLISPEWEIGVRTETLDNSSFPVNGGPDLAGPDNRVISYTVNWYRAGNNAKWQFGYTTIAADQRPGPGVVRFDRGGYFQLGLTLGATR